MPLYVIGLGRRFLLGMVSEGMYILDARLYPHTPLLCLCVTGTGCLIHMSPKTIEEMALKKLVDGLDITSHPL